MRKELLAEECRSIAAARTRDKGCATIGAERIFRMSKRCAGLALAFTLCVTAAPAREVYKCTNAQGDVAFQDKPCARADTEITVHIAEESEYAPAPVAESPALPPPPPAAPAPLKR